ncbi:RNA polymerase sigma factor [Paracrocinitomix mangrovi]|uniref:RNA polymerase sigma factor n=1 Tax=Paracrocinitomix mangrovi TaxID=2862509 RepID=UPI001C8E2626|nr:RNA polymerase sigma factor [Paracrocinitomix mangrovi]UKN01079.1 RNA polymerase sigma factor [Paracrocinitomix mangrovi]
MSKPEQNNEVKLKSFFSEEYKSLKAYVNSKIAETTDRDAEDILQDVALKLFSRNNTSPIQNVAGFVYSAIRNRIVDIMRSKKPQTTHQIELENHPFDLIESIEFNDDEAYSEKVQHELKKAISNLKPKYRQIIMAIDFEGYSYKELSEQFEIPIGTLMSRRHRALALLHKQLASKNFK